MFIKRLHLNLTLVVMSLFISFTISNFAVGQDVLNTSASIRLIYPWDNIELVFKGAKDVYYMKKDEWIAAYSKDPEIRQLFKEPSQIEKIMKILSDGNLDNDELKIVFFKEGYINFLVETKDPSLPKNKYLVSLNLGAEKCDLIKSRTKWHY